ncbi:MAG: methyl-accepting chemotaxis protein, partial [Solirubrobacteraceae bacterium]
MQLFKDLSLKRKLAGIAGALVALLLLAGTLAVTELRSSAGSGRQLYAQATVPIEQLGAIGSALGNVDTDVLRGDTLQGAQAAAAQAFTTDSAALEQALRAYHGTSLSPAEQTGYASFVARWSQYRGVAATILGLVKRGTAASVRAAGTLYAAQAAPLNDLLDATVARLLAINDAQARAATQQIGANQSSGTALMIAIVGASVLLSTVLTLLFSRYLRREIQAIVARLEFFKTAAADRLTTALAALAEGDLTRELPIKSSPVNRFAGDELGDVQRQIEQLRDHLLECFRGYERTRANLNELVGNVSGSADHVTATSRQMAATSDEAGRANGEIAHAVGDIAHGAERQVRMVDQARRSAEEVSHAVTESAASAQQTAVVAHGAREIAQRGVAAAEQADEAMRSVRDSS